jgi:hypothetical protein
MAIQILPEKASIGQLLGTGLGTGLSQGLQALAQQKMAQLAQRQQQAQTATGLESLNMPAGQASAIAMLPPQLQQQVLKNIGTGYKTEDLMRLLGGTSPEGGPIAAPQPAQGRSLLTPGATPRDVMDVAKFQQRGQLAEQKLQQQRELQGKRVEERRRETIHKSTQKLYDDIQESGDAAEEQIPLLWEYKRLKQEGSGATPMLNTLKDSVARGIFGKDAKVDWALGTTEQMQQKITSQLLRRILKGIKGRPSQVLIQEISKGNPNVFTDPEVQEYVVNAGLFEAYLKQARRNIAAQLIAKNDGYRPADFNELLSAEAKKAERALAAKFLPTLPKTF